MDSLAFSERLLLWPQTQCHPVRTFTPLALPASSPPSIEQVPSALPSLTPKRWGMMVQVTIITRVDSCLDLAGLLASMVCNLTKQLEQSLIITSQILSPLFLKPSDGFLPESEENPKSL